MLTKEIWTSTLGFCEEDLQFIWIEQVGGSIGVNDGSPSTMKLSIAVGSGKTVWWSISKIFLRKMIGNVRIEYFRWEEKCSWRDAPFCSHVSRKYKLGACRLKIFWNGTFVPPRVELYLGFILCVLRFGCRFQGIFLGPIFSYHWVSSLLYIFLRSVVSYVFCLLINEK